MSAVTVPPDEELRLSAVHRLGLLDAPRDTAFDRATALAARVFDVPVSVISVVDAERIWFASTHGLDVAEIELVPGLCASVILSTETYVVTNAETDPRTKKNPLVTGPLGLRFYAAVPLHTPDGIAIGTLAVLDTVPRSPTDDQLASLRDLGDLVVSQIELRRRTADMVAGESLLRQDAERLADALQASLLPPAPPRVPGMEVAVRFVAGERGLRVGGDFFDVFRRAPNDWALTVGDVCGKGARAASLTALARWTLRASAVHQVQPADVLRDLNTALLTSDSNPEDDRYCTVAFARLELDTCGAWVTLASSGHPPPVLVRGKGAVQLVGEPSLPLGMFAEVEPQQQRVGLGPGDAVVFYTDGVTEARDAQRGLLGEERLVDLLAAAAGGSADELADAVLGGVRRFSSGSLADDLAILVVRVPVDAQEDPMGRVLEATGIPPEELQLPGYPHGC